jgi:excisionase family DNA binding protein
MARKFVTIEEAAESLGVTVDEINEMRERGEIHAYRDGGSWKFREDEVERVQADRAGGGDDFGLSVDDSPDSVLLDEGALGGSGKSGGSTIIGGRPAKPSESDLEVSLEDDGTGSKPTQKATGKPSSAIGAAFEDLDDLSLDLDAGSVKGKAPGGSAIDLTGEDEDLVLEPAADSDITRQAGDSGIQLAAPTDSGLSLEQPLEIGGSSVDSFELGEGSAISFDEKAPADAPTQVKAGEDDFLLTPMQTADDDEDSGSQVIALDDDETLDVEGASSPRAGAGLLEEEEEAAPAGRTAAAGETVYVTAPELPYTGWNVTALTLCTIVLLFAGMMTFEMLRHMWSWEEPFVANGAIMDVIAGWFKK